ncbi:MAG: acetyl-CoA carboxylase, biotin carboxyl carrier protein, partial [Cytophagaceae bacterium]
MSTQDIQQLIDFIAKSGLDEVKIETSELKINVKRSATQTVIAASAPAALPAP